jgi:hypothetical protein
MNPADPDTLLVAMWERRRDGFDSYLGPGLPEGYDGYDPIEKWGEGAGLYKTTDGGKNFKKITAGLPTCKLGRIGLDYFRKDPNIVFAVVDSEKIGMGTPPKKIAQGNAYLGFQAEDAKEGVRLTQIVDGSPAAKAGLHMGDIIRGFDKKTVKSYTDLIEELRNRSPGDKVTLTVKRDDLEKKIEATLGERKDKKKTGNEPKKGRPYQAYYGGQKENMQDQQGPESF